MFGVFNNSLPAIAENYPPMKKGNGWDNHLFNTLKEAQEYANKWLGEDFRPQNENGNSRDYLLLNEEYQFGYGCACDNCEDCECDSVLVIKEV